MCLCGFTDIKPRPDAQVNETPNCLFIRSTLHFQLSLFRVRLILYGQSGSSSYWCSNRFGIRKTEPSEDVIQVLGLMEDDGAFISKFVHLYTQTVCSLTQIFHFKSVPKPLFHLFHLLDV